MSQTEAKEDKESHVDAFSENPINKNLTAEEKINFYRQMMEVRCFEERAVHSYQQGKIGGFCHTYNGQEAVAIGTISMMQSDDHIITAYRDHAHGLAVGMNMNECMAELYGKVTGCSKGKGGSMHFFAPDKNYWGGHAIVGGQIPLGAGIAFALKYKGTKGVCLCYMGDGAVNQGAFHEALNLAALWKLPVVFIIENNRYSMGTSEARSSSVSPLARRALAYDMGYDTGIGNSVYEVRVKTEQAMEKARSKNVPTLLEFDTYRYRGHSMSDPDKTYRTKDEIADYKNNQDPIMLFGSILIDEGIASEESLIDIKKESRKKAEASAKFADESPFPEIEDITKDVYWEEDNPEHKTSEGTMFFK